MNYIQLNNNEGESMGILSTNLTEPEIQELWAKYVKHYETQNFGIDEFIDIVKAEFPNMEVERFFIDAEINP
jgi:hypothetical protein